MISEDAARAASSDITQIVVLASALILLFILVSGTVRIANALGMAVVAEGVETERQMKLLRLAGCDQLQGFWFSQPMPIESIRALHQVRRC